MSQYLFNNNALTTLGSNLGSGATSMTVAAGTGNDFPSPVAGQVVSITLIQSGSTTGTPNEIVYATARAGDTLTILRGQEGTTAQDWSTGDIVANMATAAYYNQQATAQAIQQQAGNFADDTGAANGGIAALSPTPGSLAYLVGVPIRILKMGSSNTAAYTLNLNGLGPQAVTIGGVPLVAGQLLRNMIFEVMWDGTNFELMSFPGIVANANLALMAAGTVKANITGAAATPADVALSSFVGLAALFSTTQVSFTLPLKFGGAIVNLEVQVFRVVVPNGGSSLGFDITFPEPFSTACIGAVVTQTSPASGSWTGSVMGALQSSLSETGCSIIADTCNTANGHGTGSALVIAIGF